MPRLKLSNSTKTVLVDRNTFQWAKHYVWRVSAYGAAENRGVGLLAREVARRANGGRLPKGVRVYHQDRSNKLDCRMASLVCTRHTWQAPRDRNRGVHQYRRGNRWVATAQVKRKQLLYRVCRSEHEARRVRRTFLDKHKL